MNRYSHTLNRAASSLALTILAIALAGAISLAIARLHGDQLLSVQTASMVPTFRPGDALVVTPLATNQVRIGQIVSYHSPQNPRVIISHRVISHSPGQIITAGDALHSPDPPINSSQLIGQATAVAPGLGQVLDFLHTPRGLLAVVYLPAIGLIIGELRNLAARNQRVYYRLAGRSM